MPVLIGSNFAKTFLEASLYHTQYFNHKNEDSKCVAIRWLLRIVYHSFPLVALSIFI